VKKKTHKHSGTDSFSYFTIATPNFAAQARVLVKSVLACCNPKDVTIFLVGRDRHEPLFADLPCTVRLAYEAVGEPLYEDLVTRYGTPQVCFALKPMLADTLLFGGASKVIFADADCLFLSAPTEAEHVVDAGAAVALTPHILGSAVGDHYVDDMTLLRTGSLNGGFFGVSSSEDSRAFLSWWRNRTLSECSIDEVRGTYYEQKWLDLAPAFFPATALVRDPGYNVAYWNMHHRNLAQTPDGRWTVCGRPVVFVHFSQWLLATMTPYDYTRRYICDQKAADAARPLLEAYAAAVEAERAPGGVDTFSIEAVDVRLPDGSPITPMMRRALWRNIEAGEGRTTAILDVLNAPSPRMPQYPPYILTNFYEEFWLSRTDLRYNKFDIDRAEGLRAYIRWLVEVGQKESAIPDSLMAAAKRAVLADAERAKEQAERAKKQAEQRAAELEAQLAASGATLDDVQAELAGCRVKIGEQEAELAGGRARIAELDAKLATGLARIAELDANLATGLVRIAELDAKFATGRARIADQEAELEACRSAIGDLAIELTKWRDLCRSRVFRAVLSYLKARGWLTKSTIQIPMSGTDVTKSKSRK
jgi:uncharacterized coiled-coil protein SlyX